MLEGEFRMTGGSEENVRFMSPRRGDVTFGEKAKEDEGREAGMERREKDSSNKSPKNGTQNLSGNNPNKISEGPNKRSISPKGDNTRN